MGLHSDDILYTALVSLQFLCLYFYFYFILCFEGSWWWDRHLRWEWNDTDCIDWYKLLYNVTEINNNTTMTFYGYLIYGVEIFPSLNSVSSSFFFLCCCCCCCCFIFWESFFLFISFIFLCHVEFISTWTKSTKLPPRIFVELQVLNFCSNFLCNYSYGLPHFQEKCIRFQFKKFQFLQNLNHLIFVNKYINQNPWLNIHEQQLKAHKYFIKKYFPNSKDFFFFNPFSIPHEKILRSIRH